VTRRRTGSKTELGKEQGHDNNMTRNKLGHEKEQKAGIESRNRKRMGTKNKKQTNSVYNK
jgi:hypothetical protein